MRARLLVLLLVASVAYAAEDADKSDSVTISRPLIVKLLESNKRLREQLEKAYDDADKVERERDTCMDSRTT